MILVGLYRKAPFCSILYALWMSASMLIQIHCKKDYFKSKNWPEYIRFRHENINSWALKLIFQAKDWKCKSIIIPFPWPTFSIPWKLIFQATHWKCNKFYSRPLTNIFHSRNGKFCSTWWNCDDASFPHKMALDKLFSTLIVIHRSWKSLNIYFFFFTINKDK